MLTQIITNLSILNIGFPKQYVGQIIISEHIQNQI